MPFVRFWHVFCDFWKSWAHSRKIPGFIWCSFSWSTFWVLVRSILTCSCWDIKFWYCSIHKFLLFLEQKHTWNTLHETPIGLLSLSKRHHEHKTLLTHIYSSRYGMFGSCRPMNHQFWPKNGNITAFQNFGVLFTSKNWFFHMDTLTLLGQISINTWMMLTKLGQSQI